MTLWRVTGERIIRHRRQPFCAGILVDEQGIVRRTAPILAGMKGWAIGAARRVRPQYVFEELI